MILKRLGLVALLGGLGLATSACVDGYGYSGVSLGYGTGGYYDDGYYGGGYGGYGYAPSYYGWYGDYYYPGNGYYVYDRYRRPYRWNDGQRRYWQDRRGGYRGSYRDNWGGFQRGNPTWGNRGDRPDRNWRGDRGGWNGDRGGWHGNRWGSDNGGFTNRQNPGGERGRGRRR